MGSVESGAKDHTRSVLSSALDPFSGRKGMEPATQPSGLETMCIYMMINGEACLVNFPKRSHERGKILLINSQKTLH